MWANHAQKRYEDAQAQLLLLSLIKINEEKGYISLHRLVQEAYYDCLAEDARRDTFVVVYKLLAKAFPRRAMRRQMYLVWRECDLLMPHIEAAFDKYGELRGNGLSVQDPALDTMMADATWYVGSDTHFYHHLQGKCRPSRCALD